MADTLYPVNAVAGAPAYSGRMLRQTGSPAFGGATAARPLGARSGVRPGTSVTTVTATGTTWSCGAFAGVADVEAAAEAGPYQFAFDAIATGGVAAANASYPRSDIVYVQVDDPSESDGSTVPVVTRKYLAGVAGAGAPVPALPVARAFIVAVINVPVSGGGAPTVTWIAPYAVAAGGVLPVPSSAGYPATPHVGQLADNAALGGLVRWNGAAWALIVPPQPTRGVASFQTDAAGLGYINHGLPSAPSVVLFTIVPGSDTVGAVFKPTIGAITPTQIQVISYRTDSNTRLLTTNVTLHWVAYP